MLVLVAGGVIVTQFLRSAVDYYCNVDEIGARSGCDADRRLRLQGVVERGSIVEDGGDTDFVIAFNGVSGARPLRRRAGRDLQGVHPGRRARQLRQSGAVFEGDRVEVKHSDEYVAVNDERLEEADELADACDAAES